MWGYGIKRIMMSSVPDMSSLQSRFPHIPATAFSPLALQEVVILIGLNMSEIMPSGGQALTKLGESEH